MGQSDICVTLNTCTHLGQEDAAEELRRMKEAEAARREQEKPPARRRMLKNCSNPINHKVSKALCELQSAVFYSGKIRGDGV